MAQSDQTSVVTAYAVIYTFKADSELWTLKGDGYSRVDVYADPAKNYKITGVTVAGDNKFELILNVAIFKEMIYHKTQPNFHQFADRTTLWGLRFISDEDADRFSKCIVEVIDGKPTAAVPTTTWASAQSSHLSEDSDRARTGSLGRDRVTSDGSSSSSSSSSSATMPTSPQPHAAPQPLGSFGVPSRFEPAKPRAKILGANREMSPHPQHTPSPPLLPHPAASDSDASNQPQSAHSASGSTDGESSTGSNSNSNPIRMGSRLSSPGGAGAIVHPSRATVANSGPMVIAKSPLSQGATTKTPAQTSLTASAPLATPAPAVVKQQVGITVSGTPTAPPGTTSNAPPPRGNPALAALPAPPSPDPERRQDAFGLMRLKRHESATPVFTASSPPASFIAHAHSAGTGGSVLQDTIDQTVSPRPDSVSTPEGSSLYPPGVGVPFGRLELNKSPPSSYFSAAPQFSPHTSSSSSNSSNNSSNNSSVNTSTNSIPPSVGGNTSPRLPSSPKARAMTPSVLPAPPSLTAKLSPIPRVPPPVLAVKNLLPNSTLAPPQFSPPRSPVTTPLNISTHFSTSSGSNSPLAPMTPSSGSASSASPLGSAQHSTASPLTLDPLTPALSTPTVRANSPFVTLRGGAAAPPGVLDPRQASAGVPVVTMRGAAARDLAALIPPPVMSTPGTSLAIEKFEIPDDSSRHALKLDPNAPQAQPLRVALDRLEEVFPQAGKLSNATLNALPRLFRRAVEYLELEGPSVERVFGFEYLEKLDRLERLRVFIDKESADLRSVASAREQTVHLVAELLKRFCRDFPAGLINLDSYDPPTAFVECQDDQSRLKYVQELANSLPSQNRAILELLLSLLNRIAVSPLAAMDAGRLAAVFAPLCYRHQLIYYKRPTPVPLRLPIEW